MIIKVRSKPAFGVDRFFTANTLPKPSNTIKPPPKVDSKLKPVSFQTTVKTTALAVAPPVRGWRNGGPPETAAAYHEAGHALAITLAFRNARWLPHPPPSPAVRYVEITDDGGGNCVGMSVYSTKWDISCIKPRYRPLMEAQAVVHLSGGVSEAIYRGERRKSEVLAFAMRHCDMDGDLQRASDVLAELRRLTGYRFEPRDFVDRTLTMLLTHWCAVEALAEALVDHGRIEGDEVEDIVVEAIEDLMAQ